MRKKVISIYLLNSLGEKCYKDAVAGYSKAQDFENLVRVLLENLHDVESAVKVIRKTHSRDSAKLIVKFLQEKSDYRSVIEFCLIAGMDKEAYEIAQVTL